MQCGAVCLVTSYANLHIERMACKRTCLFADNDDTDEVTICICVEPKEGNVSATEAQRRMLSSAPPLRHLVVTLKMFLQV